MDLAVYKAFLFAQCLGSRLDTFDELIQKQDQKSIDLALETNKQKKKRRKKEKK